MIGNCSIFLLPNSLFLFWLIFHVVPDITIQIMWKVRRNVNLCFIVVVLCFLAAPCRCVRISQELQRYISEVLEKCEKGEIARQFHELIPERPSIHERPLPQMYTRPSIFIWDPLQLYQDVFSIKPLVCPVHQELPLQRGRWSDGSSNSLNPRLMLTNEGPALLVFREYYCSSGEERHYVRSTDAKIISYIGSFIEVPFILTYKSGCTRSFLIKIRELASNGVSLNLIQAMYIENQLQKCSDLKQRYLEHCRLYSSLVCETEVQCTWEKIFSDYASFMANLCPSDDFIGDLFLRDFEERKQMYVESMSTTTANALMADHTFKVK